MWFPSSLWAAEGISRSSPNSERLSGLGKTDLPELSCGREVCFRVKEFRGTLVVELDVFLLVDFYGEAG